MKDVKASLTSEDYSSELFNYPFQFSSEVIFCLHKEKQNWSLV